MKLKSKPFVEELTNNVDLSPKSNTILKNLTYGNYTCIRNFSNPNFNFKHLSATLF